MPTKPSDKSTPDEGSLPTDTTRYRVLSGGINAPIGRPVAAYTKGEIVTGEQLGDAARVAKLLARQAIEVVTDD